VLAEIALDRVTDIDALQCDLSQKGLEEYFTSAVRVDWRFQGRAPATA
jgi:hypothetical protein